MGTSPTVGVAALALRLTRSALSRFASERVLGLAWWVVDPIIMLSVHASTRIVGKALQEGADDFLIKPVAMQVLQERVEKCLHKGAGYRERREQRQAG